MPDSSQARDYERIERAIHYLRDHYREQPSLGDVADHVGLSEYHFQRLFRRWAGVSPKRFVQHLTAQLAHELLSGSATVLDTSMRAGLSSVGRLHDLTVAVDAMTPGEVRAGGHGIEIRYGVHPTLFGTCVLGETSRGICALHFVDDMTPADARDLLTERWPRAELVEDTAGTAHTVGKIFNNTTSDTVRLHVGGTNFQLQVWRALLEIPPGDVVAYGELAARIGRPRAVRAVGTAVGQNPIAYLIPCHRVIRATGAIGEYRWGPQRKQAMLALEGA